MAFPKTDVLLQGTRSTGHSQKLVQYSGGAGKNGGTKTRPSRAASPIKLRVEGHGEGELASLRAANERLSKLVDGLKIDMAQLEVDSALEAHPV